METIEDHLANTSVTSYYLTSESADDPNDHIRKLQISLDSRSTHFNTGDVVSGRFKFLNEKSVLSKGIFIEVRGRSVVKWSERIRIQSGYEIKSFEDSVEYFRSGECIYRPQNNSLAMDSYELPFSFQLPKNIPSSYQGEDGEVIYYLKCEIYGHISLIKCQEIELNLTSRLNLNHVPQARTPIKFLGIHTSPKVCCSYSGGPLTVSIDLAKSGFMPSENIMIEAEIKNKSNTKIITCEIKLFERATFHRPNIADGEKESVITRVLKEQEAPGIAARATEQWDELIFEVPQNIPPSGLEHCEGIDLEYFLQFRFVPKNKDETFEIDIPIVIGTILLDIYAGFGSEFGGPSHYGSIEQPPDYDSATKKDKKSRKKKAAEFFSRIRAPSQKLQEGTLSADERVCLLKNASKNLRKGSKELFNIPEPNSLTPLSI